ncbi:MAG: hypothetical protein ACK5O1_06910 [Holosporales bacterium]
MQPAIMHPLPAKTTPPPLIPPTLIQSDALIFIFDKQQNIETALQALAKETLIGASAPEHICYTLAAYQALHKTQQER